MPTTTMPETATSSLSAATRPLRILYAEDMNALRELMSIAMTQEGHFIETVGNGSEALERLTQPDAAFDLLITDHEMPRLNGLELVRQVRQLPYAGKIVVLSAELTQTLSQNYRDSAVDLILPKPIFPVTLRLMLGLLFAPHNLDGGSIEQRLAGA
jgi:two-component system chemotaxis response regulator CheY